jgi:prephenate dehydrogenase
MELEKVLSSPSHVAEKVFTKREYLAALALQSIMKSSTWIEFSQRFKEHGIITNDTLKIAEVNSKIVADICVKYADALLERLQDA